MTFYQQKFAFKSFNTAMIEFTFRKKVTDIIFNFLLKIIITNRKKCLGLDFESKFKLPPLT